MSIQYLIAGYGNANETGARQFLIAGGVYLNDTSAGGGGGGGGAAAILHFVIAT